MTDPRTTLARRWTRFLLWAGIAWTQISWFAAAWAAQNPYGPQQQEEVPPKTYVPVYIIIIMSVTLGLMAVCRMGKRSKDVRRS